jgi:hypothetical protein
MDERDAKVQGLEIHRRNIAFVRGYVTCTTCGCNYYARDDRPGNRVPTFCQKYSIPIDPAETDRNTLRAESCDQWVHETLDRNMVVHPNHTYRYEDGREGD